MQTVSANASTPTHLVTIVSTPLEMKTVIAPKVSGIAAAIGDRKTRRRTTRRIGRAISSARSLAEIDPDKRIILKKAGLLTRDPRKKESKKYGLVKARKAKQYTKR